MTCGCREPKQQYMNMTFLPFHDPSTQESNVLDTSCKRDCSVELNLDELKQGERYEARVRAKISGNDFKSMWSDWSPTASWVSPIGGTKEPPPDKGCQIVEGKPCSA